MSAAGISRRQWMGLGALVLGGLSLSRYLRQERPLGRDVSELVDVPALLNAPGYPEEVVGRPAISMLVFSDYACGVCRRVEPWWRKAVRNAGDVRVVHRDWPILGAPSLRAARLALAAAKQARYLPVHDALMRSPGLDETALQSAVAEAGADWALLIRDLRSAAAGIDAKLARTAQDALRLGFSGTPGYLIGSIRIEGGASERQFAEAIERARESGRS